MNSVYQQKVELLLKILPFITDEKDFAIHGGTAINLFVKDLYRLSVDIDLTYIPLEDRNTSLKNINDTLLRIGDRISRQLKGVRVIPRLDISKITCEYRGCQVKIEVNQTKRGLVGGEAQIWPLCNGAQKMFGVEVEARIVPLTQLYGGKITAALSRQHPRDIFDVMLMDMPFDEVKEGFIFCLLGSDRPIHESFSLNLIDQREVMENQFAGMTNIPFDYSMFEDWRNRLVKEVNEQMSQADKKFLVDFENLSVDWETSPYRYMRNYPSVKWKIANLEKLKKLNLAKLKKEADRLREVFHS